ncbi:MAG: hypothetical protein KC457_32695, partial [Myxococcales bacterium]|nr:hypothetical protein [Myxococcales bacterium]
ARLAAERAAEALAFDTAARLYALAAECDPDDVALRIRWAEALVDAGRLGDAGARYLDCAESTTDPGAAARLRRQAAEQYLLSGRIDEGMAILRPLLQAAGISFPRSPMTALFGVIFRSISLDIRGLDFDRRSEDQLDRTLIDRIDLCWAAGRGLGSVDVMRGAYFLTRALQLALQAGEPRRTSRGLAQFGLASIGQAGAKQITKGRAHIDRAAAIGVELDDPSLIAFAKINAGTGAMTLGEWREAWDKLREGVEILESRCTGVAWELSFARSVGCNVLRNLGSFDELTRSGQDWLNIALERGDRYGAVWMRVLLSAVTMAADDADGAERALAESLEDWTPQLFTPQHLLIEHLRAEIERYRGDPQASLARFERLWKTAERSFAMGWQVNLVSSLQARATSQIDIAARVPAERERWLSAADKQARK